MAIKHSLFLIFLTTLGCATSPTGRKQFIIVSDSQLALMASSAFTEMKSQTPQERDPRTLAYINCVAKPLIRESSGRVGDADWEVVVFKSDQVNAFAMPGGKIGVYTGLLKVAKTQDQLAAVLGHEVGHVMARHSAERMSAALATQAGLVAADQLLDKKNSNRGVYLAALGLGAQFGVLLPHSRGNESEADVIGLELMAQAGFDPRSSIELWQNMAAASQGAPPEFMSTHPSHSTRIDQLRERMNWALSIYQQHEQKRPSCR